MHRPYTLTTMPIMVRKSENGIDKLRDKPNGIPTCPRLRRAQPSRTASVMFYSRQTDLISMLSAHA